MTANAQISNKAVFLFVLLTNNRQSPLDGATLQCAVYILIRYDDRDASRLHALLRPRQIRSLSVRSWTWREVRRLRSSPPSLRRCCRLLRRLRQRRTPRVAPQGIPWGGAPEGIPRRRLGGVPPSRGELKKQE